MFTCILTSLIVGCHNISIYFGSSHDSAKFNNKLPGNKTRTVLDLPSRIGKFVELQLYKTKISSCDFLIIRLKNGFTYDLRYVVCVVLGQFH